MRTTALGRAGDSEETRAATGRVWLVMLLCLALLGATAAQASAADVEVEDQNTVPGGTVTHYGPLRLGQDKAQTFTAGFSGSLTAVKVHVGRTDGAIVEPLTIEVRNATPAGAPGPTVLATQAVPATTFGVSSFGIPAPRSIAVAAAPALTAGTTYALVLKTASNPSNGGNAAFTWFGKFPGEYAGGNAVSTIAGWGWVPQGNMDYGLATTMRVPDVDTDGDGFRDHADNCPGAANADQKNTDGVKDGGDACDPDDDNDAVADSADNCDEIRNTDQTDSDGDLAGNACDADDDNDTVADDAPDNCPHTPNTTQRDSDGDGSGDACDGYFDSTDGRTSGGGSLLDAGGQIDFSVSARRDAKGMTGACVVTAPAAKVKCLDVDGFFKSASEPRIVIVGNATVDGAPTRYRIELTDNGEPGHDDRIAIETGSGFSAAGTLAGGNLQVFKN